MKKAFKPEKQILPPTYPGGKKALEEFVRSNLNYPEQALLNKIEGSVAVDYDVDVFGRVLSAKIKHGLGYGCDEEALRLTKMLVFPKKKYQGLRVVFHMHILIHFRLSTRNAPEQPALQINYQIVPDKATGETGGYTVNL